MPKHDPRCTQSPAWVLVAISLCWLLASAPSLAWALPSFNEVKTAWRPSEAYLLDRHGEVVQEQRLDFTVRRLPWLSLEQISPALINALILAEDRRFYRHQGVDWRALAAAAWGRVTGKPPRGASTLTMQLAAMLDPQLAAAKQRRGLRQKWRQMQAAWALEAAWDKRQIVEAYLNLVGFRGELQGLAAAARVFFGKQASGLSEPEALLLAALLPSPQAGVTKLGQRACAIAQAGKLTVDCHSLQALAKTLLDSPKPTQTGADWAPHLARQLLKNPGESVTSSLDADLQRVAFAAVNQQLRGLVERNVRDGAALVVDNATGEVLAYVGSARPFAKSAKVDGIRAKRQAGSTLKPFLYGMALQRRYLTAASVLDDAPIHLETTSGLYIPQNYDRDYKGKVSVRTALASSLNIPAVRALVLLGVERFRDGLHQLGYLSISQPGEYYGFSLALGSAEVSLWEQVNAYRTLANGGVFSPLRSQPGAEASPAVPALDAGAAFIISDILSDPAGRAVTFGLSNPLTTRFWTAVKTGTSKDMRDNWCIGFSQRYTVGVWVGNFEGDSMHDVSGVTGAAPAWLEIMNHLHETAPSAAPAPPASAVSREIRYNPAIEPPRREWFLAGTETDTIQLTEPATQTPRIATPSSGFVIALDPDIPVANQAVHFTARPARGNLSFALDGKPIASASQPYRWNPIPGKHVLRLLDAQGVVYDTVEFSVRGLQR